MLVWAEEVDSTGSIVLPSLVLSLHGATVLHLELETLDNELSATKWLVEMDVIEKPKMSPAF